MMAYRVVRSPERRIFYIDVGGIAEKEVEQHMQKIVTQMKRNQVIDSESGRVDLRYNPMSIDEDYFIPVRGGTSNTRVESLPGGTYTGDVDDVKYLRDKLFSALKIPASYLTQGEEGSEDKTTLAQRDIRFARTIARLQRAVVSELEKIAVIHLYTLGYKNKDLISFSLRLNNPSKLAELQELEHWRTKFEIGAAATEGYFSRRWVAKIFLIFLMRKLFATKERCFMIENLMLHLRPPATEDAMGAEGDAAAGGADMGTDTDMGAADVGADLGAGAGTGEDTAAAPEAEGEETLLASPDADAGGALLEEPASRDDMKWRKYTKDSYTTPGAKGKMYTPVKDDKRPRGARTRSWQSHYSKETSKNTPRNVFKGSEINKLARGIYEQQETNYNEEDQILQNNFEIKQILENLEKRDKKENNNE